MYGFVRIWWKEIDDFVVYGEDVDFDDEIVVLVVEVDEMCDEFFDWYIFIMDEV